MRCLNSLNTVQGVFKKFKYTPASTPGVGHQWALAVQMGALTVQMVALAPSTQSVILPLVTF